ncbi:purine-nucleoside phosphorylase [Fodinibius sediminis]|uniref:Purine nucleoside phosphorylase n=1 Tax=Fodinibius sediminis TaxID=1214077 RepID=A0A521ALY8_9BACT|nr:purine-nucleoside phosphorylase [Fodinibius sediminis]SMO35791.1 purine-nucleoside phosphorylase [Fodinibius sediminis]
MQRETVQEFREKRDKALSYLKEQTDFRPDYLIILGTGLGRLADQVDVQDTIFYDDIPHFPVSTVESHEGRLLFGNLSGKKIVAMQGRFHYYEGYTMQQIAFPVRVLNALDIQTMIVSNACGGMNPNYSSGDIMLISDHINMLGDNPLIGPNDDELGPRFPDMSEPYTQRLQDIAEEVALERGIKMHKGVYLALSGPTMETRAEYRFLRMIGADVVGMSTVPEVIAAVHMGMEVLGLSAITDECFPDALEPVNIEKVLKAAGIAEPRMTKVLMGVLERL